MRQGGGAFASRSSDEFTSEEDSLGRAYTTNNLSTVEGQAAVMKVISDFDLEFANHKMPALVVAEFQRAQSAENGAD